MRLRVPLVALGLALFACKGGGASKSGAGSPGGALPVRLVSLEARPVSQYDDYLAALTSRRSIDLYPQVSAYVNAVHVRPGVPVKRGQALIDLDTGQPAATLRSLRAALATKRANLAYAVQNDESSQGLVESGVLSELDYQQRHAQREAAQAEVQAAQAQVQAQANLLAYYRITAPSAGVVGDVPVKVGDYVTPQTELTSVDQNELVEVYVYVPVSKVASIKAQTRIRLLDHQGCTVCEKTPTFIAQQVDPSTQSVLVKTVCPNRGELRESEILKARMIWSEKPAITVPTADVTRLAGQSFVFVAAQGPHGLHAEQRPIQLGPIHGNAYVVQSGLHDGDRLIATSVQKLHPGMPIAPAPKSAPSPDAGAAPGAAGAESPDAGACVDPPGDAGAPSPTTAAEPASSGP